MSHPTWVRGLKPYLIINIITVSMSHPTWVRGLKQLWLKRLRRKIESHPTWVRGLKPNLITNIIPISMSHPTWVRGLKLCPRTSTTSPIGVAPYMGAWIETNLHYANVEPVRCRTLHGCVD